MARGWESKSVESQIETAQNSQSDRSQELSTENRMLEREKQGLLLSRAYIQQQLQSSSNTRYTETLRRALEEINARLGNFQSKVG
jgi:hypothetical protein